MPELPKDNSSQNGSVSHQGGAGEVKEDYVSISRAAKILGVSIDTVRRWDAQGTLHSVRLDGKNRYFAKEELKSFKKNRPLSISEAAKELSVSISTLRRLEDKGVIIAERDANGERLYSQQKIREIIAGRKAAKAPARFDLFAPIPASIPQPQQAPVAEVVKPTPAPEQARPVWHKINGKDNQTITKNINRFTTFASGFPVSLGNARNPEHFREYKKTVASISMILFLSLGIFGFTVFRDTNLNPNRAVLSMEEALKVRAANEKAVLSATSAKGVFTVNISSLFNENVRINNKDLDLGTGRITASNIIYSLRGGLGITVTGGQNPIASNSGLLSIGGTSGDIALGSNLSISNNVLSATSQSVNSFANIVAGGNTITASGNNDTLTFAAGSNIGLSTSGKTITISSTASSSDWVLSGNSLYPSSTSYIVGIGNQAPTATLDVTGTFKVSGTTTFNTVTYTWPAADGGSGTLLGTDGAGNLSWVSSGSVNFFTQSNGAIYPSNPTLDFLIGGNTTASAKFAFVNVNSGSPAIQVSGNTGITQGTPSCVTTVGGIVVGTGVCQLGSEQWVVSNGLIYTGNQFLDLALGGTSTASSKFKVTGISSDTPVASLSASNGRGAYISYDGSLQTTLNQGLSLGGATTGNITLNPFNGTGTTTANGTLNVSNAIQTNGTTRITSGGNLTNIGTTQFNSQTYTWPGSQGVSYILQTDGSGGLSWVPPTGSGIGTNYFTITNGAIYPTNTTLDFLVGGTSSAAAKFGLINVVAGGPAIQINGTNVLSASTLGSGVTSSSLTTTGALVSGSIVSGFGTITTANTITGTTLNGTTGLNTGAGAGTLRVDSSGNILNIGNISSSFLTASGNAVNLTASTVFQSNGVTVLDTSRNLLNIGTTQFNTVTYTWPMADAAQSNYVLVSNGAGTLSWLAPGDLPAVNYWDIANGAIYPKNATLDLLVGGTSTASSKFAVLNMTGSGTPTASLSAGAAGGAYLTATGILQTTASQNLTLGGATTGNINLSPINGGGLVNLNIASSNGLTVNGTFGTTTGSPSCVTTTNGIVTGTGTCQLGSEQWVVANGTIYPGNDTLDLLVGGSSSASAKFGFINVNNGTPAIQISGTTVLTGTTLGSGVTSSSLTTTGALVSGSIASGFGTIATANTITGTTLNGTTGINTGAGAGTVRISNAGALQNITTTQFNTVTYTWPASDGTTGYALTTNGSGTLSWANPAGLGTNYFTINNGAIYPTNTSLDFLVGGASSAAAKFGFINVNSGTPSLQISGTTVLTGTTLGSGVTSSSLTTTGALVSGSIASGFGTIATANTITGTTLNGTTGINTGAGAGTQRIDASGNILNIVNFTSSGTTSLNGVAYTWPASATAGYVLTSGSTGATSTLSWTDPASLGTNYFTIANGSIYPNNPTLDLLVGGYSSASAKFGFINVNSGTPAIQIAGTTVLTGSTLGSGVTSSSLTTTGALVSGSIASGFGTIATANTITGTTLNGTTGINTGAGAGTQRIDASGNILNIANFTSTGTTSLNGVAYTWPAAATAGYVLTSGNTGASSTLSWTDPASLGTNYFTIANGSIYPNNPTLDLLVGGYSSASAKFGFINVNSGTPAIQISGTTVLTGTTLGSGVTSSSLTTTGALVSGSIASGFGTIATANTITGTTINGTTGINTGAGAGTVRISNAGALQNITTTQFNTVTYTWPASDGTSGYALTTNGTGTLSWANTSGFGTNYFTINNGAIYPTNTSLDFLIGGTSTASSKFAFMNVSAGTPTASISAGAAGSAYLTAAGNLATTANQNLTLGGATSGNILLSPLNGTGAVGINTSNLLGTLSIAGSGVARSDFDLRHTIGNGSGLSGAYTLNHTILINTNTDLTPTDGFQVIRGASEFGYGGVASVGTVQAIDGDVIISGAGNQLNEYVSYAGVVRADIGTGYTQTTGPVGRIWGTDFNVLGPIDVQPHLLNGVSMFMNNYYNGSPADTPSGGIWLATKKGSGMASDTNHTNADTYAIDVGLGIVGSSNDGTVNIGWNKAIQIGGTGSGWSVNTSKIGTGIDMQDYVDYGLYIHDRYPGAGGPAIFVDTATAGNVGIGTATPQYPLHVQLDGTQNLLSLTGGIDVSLNRQELILGYNKASDYGSIQAIHQGVNFEPLILNGSGGNVGIGTVSTAALLDVAGTFKVSGTTTFNTVTYTWPATDGGAGYALTTNGAGTLSWQAAGALGTNYFSITNGAVYPTNPTLDFLVGGASTAAAKFAFMNVAAGTPTASISAGAAGATYLTAAGNLATTANQNITIGGATSGNITLSPLNGSGTVTINGITTLNNIAYTWPASQGAGYILQTDGSGTLSWVSPTSGGIGTNYFTISNGTIYPTNTSLDLLLGGTSSAAAKFGFINVNSGTPAIQIAGTTVLTGTTLGSGVTSSSLTTTGALVSGSIASGFGTIATANTITGTTLNGTTGINTGAGAGTQRIDASGNILNIVNFTSSGTTSLNGVAYTWPAAATAGYVLTSGSTGATSTLSWTDPATLGTNYFTLANGSLYPSNPTVDFLVGGTSSAAAKFGFINVNSGTPAIQIAGTTVLTGSTLGSGVTSSSLTTTGALVSGSIASGFGTIATANTITGTTLNATTGINTGAGAGTVRISNAGALQNITTTQFNTVTYTWPAADAAVSGYALTSNGSGTLSWTDTTAFGTNYFTIANGSIYPNNPTLDLLVGGYSSASAKFGFINVNSGTPAIQIAGTTVLTGSTLGSGVTSSSLTTTGALVSGSIASGFGTIATANTITGTTINGTTGINTGAGAGTQRIDASGNILNIANFTSTGTTSLNGVAYTWPAAATAGYVLTSGNTGASSTLSWTDPASLGTNYFTIANGSIYPNNPTLDLLVGGYSSASAKFGFINVNSGTPAIQIAGNTVLTGSTLGAGVTSSSLTTTGALVSGSIASGFGTIATANTITGTTINGTTGINTGAGAGTVRISNAGALQNITTTQFNTVTYTWPAADAAVSGYALTSNGSGALSWTDTTSFGTNYFTIANGSIYPNNPTLDLLVGGYSSASAKFGFINVNSGTPAIQISGTTVLTGTTLGSGVTSSSLTTTGALVSGSIASGFGTIATANTITGTTLNGTTGINTGAGAGTQRIDASGNILNIANFTSTGTTSLNGVAYTWPASATAGYVLTSGNTGASSTLSWTDPATLGTNYFTLANGSLYPSNPTLDLLVGGYSSASAKFGFINVNSGTPAIQIAGTTVLTGSTLGSGVTSSSLTTTGALVSGSIASGFGTIATANTITGTTLNGTTGINTGAGAGTVRISNAGALQNITTTQFNTVTYTWPASDTGLAGYALTTDGGGTLAWQSAGAFGTNYFSIANGAIYPTNTSLDFLIGGASSAAAKFGFINVNSGTPAIQIGGTTVLTGTTLGSGVTSSSLTTTGALVSGSIASGFGTIETANTITGTTLNGTTGINTGAGAGTVRISNAGALQNITTTQFNTITYTWPSSGQSLGYVLTTNGSGTLSWEAQSGGAATFTSANGLIYPTNITQDFALGGTATTSAKFAVLNMNSGTPTASISANSGDNATFLTGLGNLGTTNMQPLTLGGATTGDITLSPLNSAGTVTVNGSIIATSTIRGTTLNGTTGINTGATAGTQRIDNSGNLVNIGTISSTYLTATGGNVNLTSGTSLQSNGTTVLDSSRNLQNIGTTQFNTVTYTWPASDGSANYVITTNGSGTLSWVNPGDLPAVNYWNIANGALFPKNSTLDFFIGGTSTASSKFAILNVNTGVPVASLSAGTAGGAFLTADGHLSTTAKQDLILGNSAAYATTGNILLQPTGGSNVGIGTAIPTYPLQVVRDGTTSLLSLAGGVDGGGNKQELILGYNKASDYGTIQAIHQGTDYQPLILNELGGNVGIGTASTNAKLDVAGTFKVSGTTNFNTVTYTWPGSSPAGNGYVLSSTTGGVLSWLDPGTLPGVFTTGNGTIYPTNPTQDFLIGGNSTASAKFSVTGVNTAATAVNVGIAGSNQGSVNIAGVTSGVVTVTTAAAAGTWTMTLPTTGGSNGYVLTTNGSGVTSWTDAGSATLANQVEILSRIGTNADAAGTTTLFAHLAYVGESTDDGSDATLFGRLGTNTDSGQCSGTDVGGVLTAASCSNETIFGILRNLPGQSLLSQFSGDGSNGAIPASGPLTPGMYQFTGGTVNGTLVPTTDPNNSRSGLFLFVKGTLTVASGGNISVVGFGSNAGNGGPAGNATVPRGGSAGGPNPVAAANGANGGAAAGGAGGNAGSAADSLGGAGGGGGGGSATKGGAAGGASGGNGGNGGASAGAGAAGIATPGRNQANFLINKSNLFLSYGAGGGGGGGGGNTGGAGGGGGGGGGGVLWIRTHVFSNSGTVSANGGVGGAGGNVSVSAGNVVTAGAGQGQNGSATSGGAGGTNSGTNGGGGGGGAGGGVLYIEANSVVVQAGGAIAAQGGNGGVGGNGSAAGSAGAGGAGANGFLFIEIVP